MSSDSGRQQRITIVSGLPRSGTSLMMQMLEAGGLPLLTDGIRAADTDNPRGYYEVERAKQLKEDSSWLADARGKAVKVISMLLYDLPPGHDYQVLFMTRDMNEILASQRAMLERRGAVDDLADDEMRRHFETHLGKLDSWLEETDYMRVLRCSYNELLSDPAGVLAEVVEFLGLPLDVEAMRVLIDDSLYRHRSSGTIDNDARHG